MTKTIDLDLEEYGKEYYNNGTLKSEVLQIGKKKILKIYFEDGSLQGESQIINFALNGEGTVYHKNGNVLCRTNYLNNKQDGLAQRYYQNGKKAIEILYQQDEAKNGMYYKKNGFKTIMSEIQLKRKSK